MKELFEYEIISIGGKVHITLLSIAVVIASIFAVRFFLWILSKLFDRYSQKRKIEPGRRHSIFQIFKYLVYFFTFIFILNVLGIKSSTLLLSSGALLVGVGIGLQQTFNDIFSGIIMLFEGSVKVGDKLVVHDLICQVKRIGLRTTEVLTLDNVSIIIPNSILVTNEVTNWSHNRKAARFYVDVGVAYNSDIDLVEEVLLQSLQGQYGIKSVPPPSVQLINYGDSSVDFRLYFFSTNFFLIEKIKSDIRKNIFKNFRESDIEIPFPQRDLWLKNGE